MSDLLLVLLRSGAVLSLALVAGSLARKAPALRLAVYRLGLLAALVVAVASPWLREAPAPLVPVRWEPAPVAVRTIKAASVPPKAAPTAALPQAPVENSLDPLALVGALWLAGSGLLLLRLAFGYGALTRLRRACRVVEIPEAAEIAREMGVAVPTVVEGPVGSPFVAGARRPTIFLPEGWRPEPDVLRAVLRHETAHIANGDLRWNPFLRLVGIALWPQPLLWLLKRPMEAAGEELCDAQALASGMPSARYAECLLSLRPGRAPALGIGAVASRSSLGRRVEAILDSGRSHKTRLSRPTSLGLRLGALALAAGAAFVFARPRPPLVAQDPFAGWVKRPYDARVRLLSSKGKPVVGAQAWVIVSGGVPARLVRPLPVSESEVVVLGKDYPADTAATLVVRAKGHGLGFVHLWPTPKPLASLTLPEPVALAGRAILLGGKAEAGVRVKATMLVRPHEPGTTEFAALSEIPDLDLGGTTAADGTFRIDDLPPSVQVAYDVDDARFARPRYADRRSWARAGRRGKDLRLRPAARFTGRVTRDGEPAANVKVAAQGTGAGDGWGEAVSDPDGDYAIERLSPGEYNVAADLQASPDETAVARAGVVAQAGATVGGLDLALIPGVLIEGRVTDDAGKPVRTEVGVYGPAHPQTSAWVQSSKTDADGRYRLRVPPGEQYVYLMDSNLRGRPQGRKVRVDSGTQTVDFRVPRIRKAAPVAPKATQAEVRGKPAGRKGPRPRSSGRLLWPRQAVLRALPPQDGRDGATRIRPERRDRAPHPLEGRRKSRRPEGRRGKPEHEGVFGRAGSSPHRIRKDRDDGRPSRRFQLRRPGTPPLRGGTCTSPTAIAKIERATSRPSTRRAP